MGSFFSFSFCRLPPSGIPLKFSNSPILYKSKARYDGLTKGITLGVWIGFMLIDVVTIYVMYTKLTGLAQFIVGSLVLGLTFGILLGLYPFSPREFELTLSGIVVKRIIRSFKIPYEEITEVSRARWTWKGVRLMASGGLYGYFGLFRFSGLGRVWAYVTDRHKIVLIKTRDGTKYMLSPEDPDAFLEKIRAVMRKTKG